MLQNEQFFAKVGFGTTENEPYKTYYKGLTPYKYKTKYLDSFFTLGYGGKLSGQFQGVPPDCLSTSF